MEAFVLSRVLPIFKYHQCDVTTSGITTYEEIFDTYAHLKINPHKRGNSCQNFCKLVCCSRRVLESRMNFQLQLASEKKNFSLSQEIELRNHGFIDKRVQAD